MKEEKFKMPDYETLCAIFRVDFKSFAVKVFHEVSPGDEYLDNWHIDVICHTIHSMLEDDETKIILNVPPRSMKSIICSVALPAYILGLEPTAQIICVSYNDQIAEKFAILTRQVMESSWYKDVFPATRIDPAKRAVNDFRTTKGGVRFATSVEGTLTGVGGDYIIIDDPIKPIDAKSDLIREKVNNWYGSTLYSRLNNKNTGKILVIMQRLHVNDFTGYLLETDKDFRLLKFPAIALEKEEWFTWSRSVDKLIIYERDVGQPLHAGLENLSMLTKAQNNLGSYDFAAQYQQTPEIPGSSIIKPEWFKFYNSVVIANVDTNYEKRYCSQVFISWDTASKVGQENDYSVGTVWMKTRNGELLLLNLYRFKLEFPDLLKKVKEVNNIVYRKYANIFGYHPLNIIEEAGSGIALIDTLKRMGLSVKQIKPVIDKATRLKNVSHLIENGTCLFPDNKPPWWADFERELLSFPYSKHDDQCDSLSQALAYGCKPPRHSFLCDV